jgi:uncharacterized protein YtpQ (UPF0354 family)
VRAWALALAFVAIAAACSGDDQGSSEPLSAAGFADKASAAIITGSELQAQALKGPKVVVVSDASLDTFALPLDEAFADYKADPERLDEILGGIVDDAEATMERGNAKRSYAEARDHVLPILKPITALRRIEDEPATMRLPGNMYVAYLVQRKDSTTAAREADLDRWGHSVAEIHRAALANLLRQTNRQEPLKCEQKLCGWASGDGWDAPRMIVPELRRQIERKIGPAVYAVPTESVYVALPIRLADRIRAKVEHDFVTAESPVSKDLFVDRDGELVVLRP